MNTLFKIVIAITICLLVGFFSRHFQTEALTNWYPSLKKPPLTPSNILFPIAWSLIYITMGISIALVISDTTSHPIVISLFIIQLLVNFLWSLGFFYLKSPLLGFIDIIILIMLIISYMIVTWPIRIWSSLLFLPYLLWVLFASYLNGYILINN